MRETAYLLLDLTEFSVRGLLLLKLFKEQLSYKKAFQKWGFLMIWGQYLLIQLMISETMIIDRLLYGDDQTMDQSIKTVPYVLISAAFSFIFIHLIMEGKSAVKLYLIVTFYALLGLCRFLCFTLSQPFLNAYISYLSDGLIEGEITLARFHSLVEVVQFGWNAVIAIGSCTLLFLFLRWYCKHLHSVKGQYTGTELAYLMLPPLTGLIFCTFLRNILYSQDGATIRYLFEDFKGSGFLVAFMTLLLLFLVAASVLTFESMVKRQEEKSRLAIYENQMQDLMQHIKDVESLYDSIRGMSHDMKNNLYAMEVLLQDGSKEQDARQYLKRMQDDLSALELPVETGNPITDVVIGRVYRTCQKEDIDFECRFVFPKREGYSVFDICILLNNALDNALEACSKLSKEKEDRKIKVTSYEKGNFFFIEIENGFGGTLRLGKSGDFLSTKEDAENHGLGIGNMERCVRKYYGRVELVPKDGYFVTKMMLQSQNERRQQYESNDTDVK
ncbi:MAG: GHKL domain-containing protein [Lachnospiraceae bacterium]|nr:GHKL domain-containing protein [Lachnospiraceae bacterium]